MTGGTVTSLWRRPDWLTSPRPDVQALLDAAWRWHHDGPDEALTMARGVTGDVATLEGELAEIVERIGHYLECSEEPREFAYRHYGMVGGGDWLTWSERECDEILDDVRTLAASLLARTAGGAR